MKEIHCVKYENSVIKCENVLTLSGKILKFAPQNVE